LNNYNTFINYNTLNTNYNNLNSYNLNGIYNTYNTYNPINICGRGPIVAKGPEQSITSGISVNHPLANNQNLTNTLPPPPQLHPIQYQAPFVVQYPQIIRFLYLKSLTNEIFLMHGFFN